jgi:HTH-type transcriptional regulator / antitoxin HigA
MATLQISPIHNDDDLDYALSRISELMDLDPAPGSPELDLLEILSTLVEAYETKHYPIEEPDPIEAIKFRMDQMGIGIKELVPLIGESNRVYEVLNKKRPLTLRMIRNLNKKLGIPAHVLIL